MGAQQSSAQGDSSASAAPPKTCYYELLSVDRQATDDEIKKAYRRKALELHPDRNINDVQAATAKFAEVQSAYEILSDPQERAWYDSHRDAILSGQDNLDDGATPTTFRNVRLTSTEEILSLMRKFNAAVSFDDEPTGFFGISRETFEHLALEEEAAADFDNVDCPDYPTFGSSDDPYDSVVRPFYNAWAGFSTRKSFSWKDKYRLSDAPDRRIRRLMEKDNKKCREDAAREFNDAVRFLVAFVRKRDPRYLPNTQTEADRQKSLRDAAAAQAARSRAANQEKLASYEIPEWARSRDDSQGQELFSEGDDETESEVEVEILECVVCSKLFKSEKQLEAHERSKKHLKAVQQLRRQMRKDGVELGLNDDTQPTGEAAASERDLDTGSPPNTDPAPTDSGDVSDAGQPQSGRSTPSTQPSNQSLHDSDNEDYAPRSDIEERLVSGADEPSPRELDDELSTATARASITDSAMPRKLGKAKAKREKKAALWAKAEDGNVHACSKCTATFTSRTKLFGHIRDEGHAAAIPQPPAASQKKKRRA